MCLFPPNFRGPTFFIKLRTATASTFYGGGLSMKGLTLAQVATTSKG